MFERCAWIALFVAMMGGTVAHAQTFPTSRPAQAARTGKLSAHYNAKLPTLFLIGDSTVKNSWDRGDGGLWGWGHPLVGYFDLKRINVENQALGGTSSRSYISTGNWARVLPLIRSGDFVIMQFGTNDGGGGIKSSLRGNGEDTKPETGPDGQPETAHSYGWYLREYISDVKSKGATPIVCSLIPRFGWKNGKLNRATTTYTDWASAAAEQGGALFIDLNGLIADRYDKLGEDKVKPLYGPNEHVHTSWDGAVLNADCVVEGIKSLKDCPLKDYLLPSPVIQIPANVK